MYAESVNNVCIVISGSFFYIEDLLDSFVVREFEKNFVRAT